MIQNFPHMVEELLEDDDKRSRYLCTCGAIWEVTGEQSDAGKFVAREAHLLEGNGLCELPTVAIRWDAVVARLRALWELG